ncbi:hypothetical protein [Paraglaciecola sp. MB-3u-78]|jgi:WD40 repeat protein|uniref:hypothetical protein n=1 Tax=Paraglaciecola sp. MB-3u-78 TaxID=2058332 RepID=UPI000C31F77B|nr:hypothetical protein [Paraglaciecola sp. MB-3u-78]PKG97490.1 hypothetical protein CXF95_19285 [Paraglaciecola sp. MB-3u-78]
MLLNDQLPNELGPHEAFVSAVNRHPSGTVAVATGNGTIQVYNAAGESIRTFYAGDWPVQLWFSVVGQVLFARVRGDVIHQWSLSYKSELKTYQ